MGGIVTTADTLDIDGDLSINDGGSTSLDLTGDTVNLAGDMDLANLDSFTSTSSTIVFNGSSTQGIAADSNTFNKLTISNSTTTFFSEVFTTADLTNTTAGSSMVFLDGATTTISGTLTITGEAGNEVYINSEDGSTRFTWDLTGAPQTVNFVNVSNSEVDSNDVTAFNSTDATNTDSGDATPQWVFTALQD
ncbi:hypothetical protein BVY03_04700, partial [bacterium K02(2017)]